ncbi:TetR/AcrR family transcriptional regulator [Williamsia sp.]|uniref:TetR/AcrR family transcriptional regulator n=1 Tax=Williamsia sp. TaxID=1872085 RepID=UPI002F946DD1
MTTKTSDSVAAERIRRAAVEAFAESGYGGTSTREITKRLGMSATAMYPHYRSKEELLFTISLEGHQSALVALQSADDPTAGHLERLRSVVAAFTLWQAEQRQLARVVQYELNALSPAHYKAIAAIRRDTTDVITAIVEGGKKSGDFTIGKPDDVVLAISSLCVDVCRWFPSTSHRDPEILAQTYADIAQKLVG